MESVRIHIETSPRPETASAIAMNWTGILSWTVCVAVVIAVLGWVLSRSEAPFKLILRWVVTAIVVGGTWLMFSHMFKPSAGFLGGVAAAFALAIGTAVCGLILAITWGSSLISWLITPISRLFYDDRQEIEPEPLYSIAQAHRNKGRYLEAMDAVQEQLKQFPNDVKGTLMLAEIQMVDLHDMEGAEQTLETLISTATTASGVVALNQMADWRLGIGHNLEGAREALERIRGLYPDSEAAYMAGQRLAHLTDPNMVAERQTPKPIHYVEFPRPSRVGEVVDVRPKTMEPGQEAAQLVKHIEQYPEDFEAHERLATLYADHYHRMDLARSELGELIANKHAPRKKVVAWLNRLADLEIRVAGDIDAARSALQRIIDANPKVAAAEQARRRIDLLARELRGRKPT